ncbi:transcriptional regulator ATRX homolog [Culicoides brevitarsis]|uniref:transcriptional regulator ATRX homolog n=1 Tax=Culicoides brevitarsis TaxID=469753 RepID=UPI00307C1D4B
MSQQLRIIPLEKLMKDEFCDDGVDGDDGGAQAKNTSIISVGSTTTSDDENCKVTSTSDETNGKLKKLLTNGAKAANGKELKILVTKLKPDKLMKEHNLKEIRDSDNKILARNGIEDMEKSESDAEMSDEPVKRRRPQREVRRKAPQPSTSTAGVFDSDTSSDSEAKKDKSDASEDDSDAPPVRKKRGRPKKEKSDSDSDVKFFESSEDEELQAKMKEKRKRKRIKEAASSDENDKTPAKSQKKDAEPAAGSGRKNIRSFKTTSSLEETTKEAAKQEKQRLERLAERQKLYNSYYETEEEKEKRKEGTETPKRLILDFDEETKEVTLEVDPGIVACLKPHQFTGIKFMWEACFESLEQIEKGPGSGCILAHCMGLGKSLQVVSLVHTLLANSEKTKVNRVLVVCPLSTVLNWVNEFDIWCAKTENQDYEMNLYEMSRQKQNVDRAYRLKEWYEDGGVFIIGYDMFRNLTNLKQKLRKKLRDDIEKALLDPGPDLVICDEGHLLKNEKTAVSIAMNKVKTLRRVVLTGTPLQNNLKEYYCMVQFVKPNLLGKYTEYLNRFVNPITNGQYIDSTELDIKIMKRRSHVLHKMLEGCVQRRDYSVLAPFLPIKHEYVISIKLTPLQIQLYKYYMEHKPAMDTSRKAATLFSDFQNLQRIWTHPLSLRYNSDRVEKEMLKREMEETESEGSIKDFVVNSDSDEESAKSTSSDSSNDASDDEPLKKPQKIIRTRAKAGDMPFEEIPILPEEKTRENPTEWWTTMVTDDDLNNIEHSSKLIVLFSILQQCEAIGDKLLVFTQSIYSLDVIEHFLRLIDEQTQNQEYENPKFSGSWSLGLDYLRLDGSTSVEMRNQFCKIFNDDTNTRARLFLISTRAGGLGINLVAANRVVIFDVSWNPSHDIQSIFRIYRFGQKKPCYVYRFVALGTMEEKIYERQVTKEAISKRVIDEQQIDRHYKEKDIMQLYSYDLEPETSSETPLLPKDRLFADILSEYPNLIYRYHEHDSLLENKEEETLDEEERKAAWEEYNSEKDRIINNANIQPYIGYSHQGTGRGMTSGPVTSNMIYGFRSDVLLNLLRIKLRQTYPHMPETQINTAVPTLVQELYAQMKQGEITLYQELVDLQNLLVATAQGSVDFNAGAAAIFNRQPYQGNFNQAQNVMYRQQTANYKPPPTTSNDVVELSDSD